MIKLSGPENQSNSKHLLLFSIQEMVMKVWPAAEHRVQYTGQNTFTIK